MSQNMIKDMKVIPILILCLLNTSILLSQNRSLNISSKLSKQEIKEKIIDKESKGIKTLDAIDFNYLASGYALLGNMKKARKYMIKSKSMAPEWFCLFTKPSVYKTSEVTQDPRYFYYTDLMDKSFLDSLLSDCGNMSEIRKRKTTIQDPILSNIYKKDQQYRKKLNSEQNVDSITLWKLQSKNDLRNRKLLDSLYNVKETFWNNESFQVSWLVLHHSTDCEWNEKWLRRFLDEYKNNGKRVGFLPQTFERLYHPENGFCTKKNKNNASQFIESLKKGFPEEFQDIFEYRDY